MSKSGLESDRPSLSSSVCSVSNVFELGCCYHPNLGNHNILFFYAKDILMHTNLLLPKSLCSQPCDLVGCAKIRHYFCAFLAIMPSSFAAMLPIFDIERFLLFHINYSWKIFSLSHKVLLVRYTQIQVYFIPLIKQSHHVVMDHPFTGITNGKMTLCSSGGSTTTMQGAGLAENLNPGLVVSMWQPKGAFPKQALCMHW